MAFLSALIATNASTATALNAQGTWTGTAGLFPNAQGNVTDPIPFSFKNVDATITIYVGGSAVSSSNGYPLLAGQSIPANIVGDNEVLYAISASGTPNMAVLANRQ